MTLEELKQWKTLELAQRQRFEALTYAFMTIDSFATPSLPPEEHEKYEEVKAYLIRMYTPTE